MPKRNKNRTPPYRGYLRAAMAAFNRGEDEVVANCLREIVSRRPADLNQLFRAAGKKLRPRLEEMLSNAR